MSTSLRERGAAEMAADSIDLMYRRLVQNIRAGFPEFLTRPFEISQLYQHIIPYRLNRRELGVDSNESYELALMELLSGARGLLRGDEEMQRALRAELDSPNPDLTAFRAYATSMVSLDPMALRQLETQPMVRSLSPAPAASPKGPGVSTQAEVASRETMEVPLASRTAAPEVRPPATTTPRVAPAPGTASRASHASTAGCRYCGGELPEGRDATFCPNCGQNLSIKQCPACNTELDTDWRYCITCGRQLD